MGGGFNPYNSPPDTLVDHTMPPDMTLDSFGALTLERGGINVRGDASFSTVAVLFNSYEVLPPMRRAEPTSRGTSLNLNAEMDFVCYDGVGGGGGLNWYNSAADTLVDDTHTPLMTLDEFGVLTLTRGGVVLPADPTQPLEAATKQYVDNHSGGGGGGNMVYPAAGVPQSTGSAWAASIPANVLARRDQANTFALAQAFQSTVTLAADPATNLQAATKQYVDDHTSMVYPAAGIPQSTGAAWGASIVASTLAYRNQANTFTAAQSFSSTVTLAADPATNLQAATKQYVDNKTAGGGMVWPFDGGYAVSDGRGAWLASIPGPLVARTDFVNIFSQNQVFSGGLQVGTTGFIVWPDNGAGYAILSFNGVYDGNYLGIAGKRGSGGSDSTMYFNTSGTAPAYVFGMNGGTVMDVTLAGVAVTGNLTATTKSFRIPLPTTRGESDASKTLTHSCLEGPEIAVYYRGMVETSGGVALVTLPEYFEALTMDEGRTVLLTQMFDEDETEPEFALLMSSQVRGGQFTVRSSIPWSVVALSLKEYVPHQLHVTGSGGLRTATVDGCRRNTGTAGAETQAD